MTRYPIRVTHGTMKRLKSLAIKPNESYDKILKRVLDAKVGEDETVYLIDDLHSLCKLRCVIDFGELEKNILFFEFENSFRSSSPPLVSGNSMVSNEDYRDFLGRLRGIDDLIGVLSLLGHREYTVVNNLRLIRLS